MHLLADPTTAAAVQEVVFFAAASLLNLDVDAVFFDTTSTYWERDAEDPPDDDGDDGTTGFRRYGHSKDHRDDLPQIVIRLEGTKREPRCGAGPGRGTQPMRPSCPQSRKT